MRIILAVLCWLMASSAHAQDIFNPASGAQLPGTTTNDNANAGNVGEYQTNINGTAHSATATITIAAPAVVTWTGHPLCFTGAAGCGPGTVNVATAVVFTTSGALPTGLTSGTTVYAKAIDANTFNVASTCGNALAGTFITTTGTQSGTQTVTTGAQFTSSSTSADFACAARTAGDWDSTADVVFADAGSSTFSAMIAWLSGTSATPPTAPNAGAYFLLQQTFGAGLGAASSVGVQRFSYASTTNEFASCFATFATSTANCYGIHRARRAR